MLLTFSLACLLTFVLTAVSEKILIPKLKSMKLGQKILDIGPRWHKSKEGTPTMGGLGFVVSSLIVGGLFIAYYSVSESFEKVIPLFITLMFALANSLIGMIDDLTKFKKSRNEGLTARQKIFFQILCAGAYTYFMQLCGTISTKLVIPYFGINLELGIFFYVFAILFLCGIINSVNLTDGIDGLASMVTFVVGGFIALAAFMFEEHGLSVLSALIIGSTLGFLIYNYHPARVFMGDTGSLFLGALVAGAAFMMNNPIIIAIAGLIYIIEAMSDIIQVFYYKLTHKRVFKMAPIHHHFEKCGWSELTIVYVFSAFTVLTCILAWFGL